jgi:arginine utilization protein RocB
MPLLGQFYDVPVELIEKISMPCINIGPWGKDFHKMTERVNKEDLYVRTPMIINKAISLILGN